LGLSHQETYEEQYHIGYHRFERSRIISATYESAMIVDFLLAYLVKTKVARLRGCTVICDRFFPDVLADLWLSNGRLGAFPFAVWRQLSRRIPKDMHVFILNAPVEKILPRRPDLKYDLALNSKSVIYHELARLLEIPEIDASQDRLSVQTELEAAIAHQANSSVTPQGKPTEAPFFRLQQVHAAIVKKNAARSVMWTIEVILSSWLFQGLLYADRTEKYFKSVVEIAMLLPTALLLLSSVGPLVSLAVGLTISHTLNWLFFGQPLVALRSVGWVKTPTSKLRAWIEAFRINLPVQHFLMFAAIYGSAATGRLTEASDLDLKIIRKRGAMSAVLSMVYLARARFRSTLSGVPLDIYVLDDFAALATREREPGLVLLDLRQRVAGRNES
jgi:predicted nucleotidyltransferase